MDEKIDIAELTIEDVLKQCLLDPEAKTIDLEEALDIVGD